MSDALVDTHCHLVPLREKGLLAAALESAEQNNVETIISVGLNLDDSEQNRQIAEAYPHVYFTVGWHPHEKTAPDAQQIDALAELLHHPKAVAVGEVGIDCYFRPGYHEVPLDVQRRSFAMMIDLAVTHGKPAVIHDRDAHDIVMAEMDRAPDARGVMHCFSGDSDFATRCVARGLLCSFSGIVTFPRTDALQAAAASVPDDHLLVETDAPFLAPVPHRGASNLPGYVRHTAEKIARLRGADLDAIATVTTSNARAIFGLR